MKSPVLASLIDVPIALVVSNKDTLPFRPGSDFELSVVLINKGDRPLGWSQQNPLNLSYRWLTVDGELLERDGRRTTIPVSPLPPGSRVELDVDGSAPEDEGCYQLQLSLVLEGVHWACDVGSDGWVQRVTNVTPAPAWPIDLKDSRGGRALRGAMVAAELARHLENRTFAVEELQTASVSVTASDGSLIDEPKSLFQPMRDWLRTLLGVRGLEQQLADVITLAGNQAQLGRELESHILTLKEELQGNKLLKHGRPQRKENLADNHYDVDARPAFSEGASLRDAVNPQRNSRLSEKPQKSSKAARKPTR